MPDIRVSNRKPALRPEQIGPALRRLRESRGVKQYVAARRAGLTQSQVSEYELGKRLPSLRSLLLLLTALNARLGHLEFFAPEDEERTPR